MEFKKRPIYLFRTILRLLPSLKLSLKSCNLASNNLDSLILLVATDIELFTADDKHYVELSPYCITAVNRSAFSFQVSAQHNAHVALMSTDNTAGPLYEIVIGGWGNTISCIRLAKQQECKRTYFGPVVNSYTYTHFWVSWANGVISLGRSETVNQTKLIEFTHTNPYPVNFLAVMTGFGSTGNWKFINGK